jgi:tetratricopeptide (TPR) repeat protein
VKNRFPAVRIACLGAVCAAVLAVYACGARSGLMESLAPDASQTYYNLLVRGFRSGHLYVDREPPAGLSALADPYNPAANAGYRTGPNGVHDLSYFRGRLYLYFGATPALVLFWPYAAATGRYLLHREAAAIFASTGFLVGVGLLLGLRRRYFPDAGTWVLAAGALALGLAGGIPLLLARAEVYEVAIACGSMFGMLSLAAVWAALHQPDRRRLWLASAGAAFGLAVGARPSLLPASVFLLVPALCGGPRRPGARLRSLACALGPVALAVCGLLAYNQLRFGRALEFGQNYQLANDRQAGIAHFSPSYIGYNLRVYFLQPATLTRHFPFVGPMKAPPPPAGHAPVEDPFGALADIPLLWLALAAPLAWRGREGAEALRRFAGAAALLFAGAAATLCLFYGSCSRYEVEFLSPLVLLSVIGILGLERALADRPGRRLAGRVGWVALLAISVGFNLLGAVARHAAARSDLGRTLLGAGRTAEAVACLEQSVALDPDSPGSHSNLGEAYLKSGRLPDAIGEFVAALRLDPDHVGARVNLADALVLSGRYGEAIEQYGQVLRLRPGLAAARGSLGYALAAEGRLPEAIDQYEQALRIEPGAPGVRRGLGIALARSGRLPEAIAQFREAIRIRPDDAESHADLGLALRLAGSEEEAEAEFGEAARLRAGR